MKATFFVVGTKAEKYPELIQRMHNEGHLIGIHNYAHHSNWFMSPWKVRKGLKNTAKVIKSITGVTPIYYRPPWECSTFSIFIRRGKYKIILWSIMAEDWRTSGGSEKIKQRLANIKAGTSFCCTTAEIRSGRNLKLRNTINALRDVLKQ